MFRNAAVGDPGGGSGRFADHAKAGAAEFAGVGDGDHFASYLAHHAVQLRFARIRRGDAARQIETVDAEKQLVEPVLAQLLFGGGPYSDRALRRTLPPTTIKIDLLVVGQLEAMFSALVITTRSPPCGAIWLVVEPESRMTASPSSIQRRRRERGVFLRRG